MDSLHTLGFYVSAAVSTGGGVTAALAGRRGLRAAALAATGLGLAGLDLSLSAGVTAIFVVVAYAFIAWLFAGTGYRTVMSHAAPVSRQMGALAAAGLLGLYLLAAFRGDFSHTHFYGGAFGAASIGRLLFSHDAPATEAVGALALVALVAMTAGWRTRGRSR